MSVSSSSPEFVAPSPASQPVPRGTRRARILSAIVGLVLALGCATASSLIVEAISAGAVLLILIYVAALAALSSASLSACARTSTLGLFVAGTALGLLQVSVGLFADVTWLPHGWMHAVIGSGTALTLSALLMGGAVGMRMAREGGRTQAAQDRALSASDAEQGVTPQAPPSRRAEHLLSGVLTLPLILAGFRLLQAIPSDALEYNGGPSPAQQGLMVLAYLLIAGSAVLIGRSTLGARLYGPILTVAGLVVGLGLLWAPLAHPAALIVSISPDLSGVTLMSTGLILSAAGWAAHQCRAQARLGARHEQG